MAAIDVQSPSSLMPGAYFESKHGISNSIYHPPTPSPGPKSASRPTYHRSRSSRSISSIPRPVSRSDKDSESVRKRPRLDNYAYSSSRSTISSVLSTPRAEQKSQPRPYGSCGLDGESEYDLSYFSTVDSAYSRDATSPPPFVNTSYTIAGGLDTPGTSFERRQQEWGDEQEELDWRVNRYSSKSGHRAVQPQESSHSTRNVRRRAVPPRTPSSISGQKRSLEDSPVFETPAEFQPSSETAYTASGWHIRSRAWAMTGGLAYKAINFCWNTAFGGFQAGDGQSYALDIGTPEVPVQGFRVSRVAPSEDVFSNQYESQEEVPGGFPEDSLIEDYMTSKAHLSGSNRDVLTPTLQGKDSNRGSEMKGGWLIVDRPNTSKRRSRASIAGSRSNSFRNANSSRASATAVPGASFASPRSRPSMAPHRRTSSNSVHLSPERNRPSLSANPPYQKNICQPPTQGSPVRRGSLQPRSPSAMSPDVAKFEKRLRKKAREDDESMSRMNAHLQDLIRQGKEALGSKISIEHDEDDDEGFYEEGSDEDYRRGLSRQAW